MTPDNAHHGGNSGHVLAPTQSGSPLAYIDPRLRIVAAVIGAVLAVSCHGWAPLVLIILCGLIGLRWAGSQFGRALRMILAMDGFVLAMLVMLPFTLPGDTAFALWGFDASWQGIWQAVLIGLRANAVAILMFVLLSGMDAVRLGRGLSGLRVPAGLVMLFMMTVRYIDVLQREYMRLRIAMRARGFTPRNNRHTLRSLGYLLGMLLVRSHDRAERILQAMKCRGYHGQFPQLAPLRPTPHDYGFAAIMTGLFAIALTLEVTCPPLI